MTAKQPEEVSFIESFQEELARLRDQVRALAQANAHATELMADLREARAIEEILKTRNAELEQARQLESDRGKFLELVASNRPTSDLIDALAAMLDRHNVALSCSILSVQHQSAIHQWSRRIPETLEQSIQNLEIASSPLLSQALFETAPRDTGLNLEDCGAENPLELAALRAGFESLACWPAVSKGGIPLGAILVYGVPLADLPPATAVLLDQTALLLATGLGHGVLTNKLTHQARHDALTGLPNRNYFYESLQQAVEARQPSEEIAILWVDLDQFKLVNDTLGHRIGDLLLQMTAERISAAVGSHGMSARMGGDEFVVMLRGLDVGARAETLAHGMVQEFSQPLTFGEHQVTLQVSIGISLCPDHAADAETLIQNADLAMYGAKHSGRGTYQFFTQERETDALERFRVETHLRRAIEKNELEVYFQPLVSCHTGQIESLEALLRWYHPDLGSVSPAEFIPVAESSGLMVAIGEWVLERSCRALAEFHARGNLIRIAVNVSATQLTRGDFPATVARVLKQTGVNPAALELELTESCILSAADYRVQMQELRELGVGLSIDDFGTGYSSLSYLHTLPVKKLKMDRSFVMNIDKDASATRLVEAIVAMAKALDFLVVAEGVETQHQLDRLRGLGCDLLQGYFLHKPMPLSNVFELLSPHLAVSELAG